MDSRKVLDLQSGASDEEIKQAYYDTFHKDNDQEKLGLKRDNEYQEPTTPPSRNMVKMNDTKHLPIWVRLIILIIISHLIKSYIQSHKNTTPSPRNVESFSSSILPEKSRILELNKQKFSHENTILFPENVESAPSFSLKSIDKNIPLLPTEKSKKTTQLLKVKNREVNNLSKSNNILEDQDLKQNPENYIIPTLTSDEKQSLEIACFTAKSNGPASYNRCLEDQLSAMKTSTKRPDISGLTSDEKQSIEMACFTAKSNGPASYNRCLEDQLSAMKTSTKRPDISRLTSDEKQSLEMACFTAKSNGPASYNKCLEDQLSAMK